MDKVNTMKEFDRRCIYDTLEKNNVVLKIKKYDAVKGGAYQIDFNYYFDDYKIKFTRHVPTSKKTPSSVSIYHVYYGHTILMDSWNQRQPKKQYLYDMYVAVKNKHHGKPYVNPYDILKEKTK